MHIATTDILLIIFIALAAVALLGQWLALAGLGRRVSEINDKISPLVPTLERTLEALTPTLVQARATLEQGSGLINELRPKLTAIASDAAEVTARAKEISIVAREQVRKAEIFANDMGQRIELQMVRLDEALGAALASVDQISTTVRDTVLRPVQDAQAMFQGLRTGLDFFFRRRGSPKTSRTATYHDEEMFI